MTYHQYAHLRSGLVLGVRSESTIKSSQQTDHKGSKSNGSNSVADYESHSISEFTAEGCDHMASSGRSAKDLAPGLIFTPLAQKLHFHRGFSLIPLFN